MVAINEMAPIKDMAPIKEMAPIKDMAPMSSNLVLLLRREGGSYSGDGSY